MYLSDRDLVLAIEAHLLYVDPYPESIDTNSIDLRLDDVASAKVWNMPAFVARHGQPGGGGGAPLLSLTGLDYKSFSGEFLMPVPAKDQAGPDAKVYLDAGKIVLEPGGFFLWQTAERVGTPEVEPRFVCFIDGKSRFARLGLLIHLTAPTIHAGWWGNVTLEIANLGPFRLALAQGDFIAQIVVAAISSLPMKKKSQTAIDVGQAGVGGSSSAP